MHRYHAANTYLGMIEMRQGQWTKEEIKWLHDAYLCGARVKDMAKVLNRTLSYVSKAVERFLTPTTKNVSLKVRRQYSYKLLDLLKNRPTTEKPKEKQLLTPRQKLANDRNWATLDQVYHWFISQGYNADKTLSQLDQEPFFIVNTRRLSGFQFLILVNKIRLQNKLPIFLCETITY